MNALVIAETARPVVVPAAPTPARAPGGSECVLLVEDEEAVRLLAGIILRRSGYRVVEATQPAHAQQTFDALECAVDLLVTDMTMPGGTGDQLYDALVAKRPGLRAVFMSGYLEGPAAVDDNPARRGTTFLAKPFTADRLLRTVREILDREL